MGAVLHKAVKKQHHSAHSNGTNLKKPTKSTQFDDDDEKLSTDDSDSQTLSEQADSLQMVLPNIYMGSAVAAENLDLLQSVGVSHVLAIGWNLSANFPDKFKYLLINKIEDRPGFLILEQFPKCFQFMDECLGVENGKESESGSQSKLFVHCHKGLSRSATIIIGYEMYRHHKSLEQVLDEIRAHRSFIMPNIGFQAQMKKFEQMEYSLDMDDYKELDVIEEIEKILPSILNKIKAYYQMFVDGDTDNINDRDLFAKTMYIHQAHKLSEKGKLPTKYVEIVDESIEYLRKIQVEFVQDEASLKRFDQLFK